MPDSSRPKPQPKELVVRPSEINPAYLRITTGSTDAAAWVEQEAPQFGVLYPPGKGAPYYLLQVGDVWDVQEVREYLMSYGEKHGR